VSVRRDSGAIVLDGICAVEDAEPLLQMLQMTPAAPLDWTRCSQIHTAVLQVMLAAGVIPMGPCGDPWVRLWVASEPS
jgi:hypothetical protein